MRPTESLTIFLQQLGRGLRLAEDKECLTVLDFIGQANKKYRFEDKFAALISGTNKNVIREIKNGFVSVPKGCYIQLERKAAQYILKNISAAYGGSAGMIARIAAFEQDTGRRLTLANFLDEYHVDPRQIYKFSSFSRLCVRAGVREDFAEPMEDALTKALARFAAVDSRRWIEFITRALTEGLPDNLDGMERRMLDMLLITVFQKPCDECGFASPRDALAEIRKNYIMCAEIAELLKYGYDRIDFIDEPADLGFDCPLDLHCTYTRDQLLIALDYPKPGNVREGVKYLPDKKMDVFFITLNKSDKDYSPTTMYNDYSINSELFHWQSQSTTSDTSVTGKRYINHTAQGSRVLLFVREYKADSVTGGAAAYTFLGTAKYVSHEGSRPMNIVWKLDRPIPARCLKKTNKLMVG